MYFRDIVGHEDLKRRLRESARKGIVPHAQLFAGPDGAGAFPLALAYARYLNCKERTETDACGHCPSCRQYDVLQHPDLHFVFPIVKKERPKKEVCDDYLPEWRALLGSGPYFGIDDWLEAMDAGNSQALIYARESDEIIRKLSLRIYEAEYRVLFVWLPERLHLSCANKLLKLIEEPAPHTLILLVSAAPDMVLGTIQSRAQSVPVRPVGEEEMQAALQEREHLDAEAAREVAHLAGGNYLHALGILGAGEENSFFLTHFKSMFRNAWTRNARNMRAEAEELAAIGRERQKNYLAYCQRLLRENFIYRFHSPEINYLNREEEAFSKNFAPYVNEGNVCELMDEFSLAEQHIAQNANAKMVFFDLHLHVASLVRRNP
ncbi:MAG: DNA polymerase III subunit delta [Tannerella sp.]|jgi:DNA polymerase-3 subunit delta'|nr:DNA polymerase III subunit delta [Tannerella sp.]